MVGAAVITFYFPQAEGVRYSVLSPLNTRYASGNLWSTHLNVYILKYILYFTRLFEVKGIVGYLAIPVGYVLGKMAMEQVHFQETWSVLVRLRIFIWNPYLVGD